MKRNYISDCFSHCEQGRRHEFEGGWVNALKGGGGVWGVNTVKTLKFEKGGGDPHPPSSYGGAVSDCEPH